MMYGIKSEEGQSDLNREDFEGQRYMEIDDGKGNTFYYCRRWHQIAQLGNVLLFYCSQQSNGESC